MKLLAVELGIQQERREVVARILEVFLDAVVEVDVELAALDHGLPLFGTLADVLEHHADESPEQIGVRLRKPEHLRNDPQRDVLRVVNGCVELRLARDAVQKLVAKRAGVRLVLGDLLGAERGQQDATRHLMKRRIRRDRGRDADRRGEIQLRRPDLTHDDGSRREVLGVVRDVSHGLVRHG
jgi:hypothetical protein